MTKNIRELYIPDGDFEHFIRVERIGYHERVFLGFKKDGIESCKLIEENFANQNGPHQNPLYYQNILIDQMRRLRSVMQFPVTPKDVITAKWEGYY